MSQLLCDNKIQTIKADKILILFGWEVIFIISCKKANNLLNSYKCLNYLNQKEIILNKLNDLIRSGAKEGTNELSFTENSFEYEITPKYIYEKIIPILEQHGYKIKYNEFYDGKEATCNCSIYWGD